MFYKVFCFYKQVNRQKFFVLNRITKNISNMYKIFQNYFCNNQKWVLIYKTCSENLDYLRMYIKLYKIKFNLLKIKQYNLIK